MSLMSVFLIVIFNMSFILLLLSFIQKWHKCFSKWHIHYNHLWSFLSGMLLLSVLLSDIFIMSVLSVHLLFMSFIQKWHKCYSKWQIRHVTFVSFSKWHIHYNHLWSFLSDMLLLLYSLMVINDCISLTVDIVTYSKIDISVIASDNINMLLLLNS